MEKVLFALTLFLMTPVCLASDRGMAHRPCTERSSGADDTLTRYVKEVESQPLQYAMTDSTWTQGVEQRTYHLVSQSWSPERLVTPAEWQHEVTLYIPDDALRQRALLIVNNGRRSAASVNLAIASSDFTNDALAAIAKNTKTVVAAVNDVPNQFLTYTDDGKPRAEDDSVAHSWKLFMDAPEQRETVPLQVPMVASLSRAMTLAQRELASLQINRFIVSGVSKRAWASWLAVVADSRIDAVVPFAIDLLNTRQALMHMYRSYGGAWPIAFYPYYAETIDLRIATEAFGSMMRIADPLQYLDTRHAARLEATKYIVNASGDDFFVPDGASLYYDKLPGSKVLRMVPNSSHGGIRNSTVESLSTFVNRFQRGIAMPQINATLQGSGSETAIAFRSSEQPQKLTLWRATNPDARDFRYACDIRYVATAISPLNALTVPVAIPPSGWSAYFVEATFSDGFVATSQTYILGKNDYPNRPAPSRGSACRTLPGRGSMQ